jgi:hypothetical protein
MRSPGTMSWYRDSKVRTGPPSWRPPLLEVARYFAALATYDRALDRYEIRGVMGPDEYHDGYPRVAK